ncbi:TolC family protein [Tundrisphaera lichenicola]|uniref:TolC family protein n=1 Tax=Tundrisphaera lichenicola TaxID=2029860 RepID=UPI003EBB3A28
MPLASTSKPSSGKDEGLQRAALQEPAQPAPNQDLVPNPDSPAPSTVTAPGDKLQTPKIPGDPDPEDFNLGRPVNPRPDLGPGGNEMAEEITSNLAKMFVPQNVPFDEAVAAGLPADSRPYILTMEKAFQLALVNSRYYQFQLESMYINALPVTLQRFSFGPQFVAGLSPRTGVGGAGSSTLGGLLPTQNFGNSFLYNTRETGAQVSTLNIGTVAGVGKLLDNGTQILASFANQLVFNFVGRNPTQPTVRSFLPLQILVPFLRGGGRAITLEGLTQAERSLLYSVRSFAKFRQEFVVSTLVGGSIQNFGNSVSTGGFTSGGNIDPVVGFLQVVTDAQLVENQVKNLAVFEQFVKVYQELIGGESSGLSQLQLDQISQQVQGARQSVISSRLRYRNDLDQFKIQLGMPPDVPLVIDRSRTSGFLRIFEELDRWSLKAKRELPELDEIVARLPELEDLVLDGRSCLKIFSQDEDQNLEDLLLTAERIALENRLDLMNARAQLYDTWRQIRVSANALKGILNVAVTNQFLTPPTTNNPFGFVDQAKQFSLVINAELPLVRVAERNNFRQQLINYQRQRRTLQNTEDFLKNQLRSEIRQLQVNYQQYLIARVNLVFSIRLKDQAFETIVAPPAGTAGTQGAVQTTNLISFQNTVVNNENTLVSTWFQYQLQRLQVYRDLGILPFDEWEAFDELFPTDRTGGGYSAAVGPDGRPAVARPALAPSAVERN